MNYFYQLSKHLKIFSLLAIGYTVIFLIVLYTFVDTHNAGGISIAAFVYAIVMWLTGFGLGSTDEIRKTRINLPFFYHVMTYITVNTTGLIYIVLFRRNTEDIIGIVMQILIWGILLGIHYRNARKSIKGLRKEEVFR